MSLNSQRLEAPTERPLLARDNAAPLPQSIARARSRSLTPDGFFHLTMVGLTLVFLSGSAVGLYLTQTILSAGQVLGRLLVLTILLIGAAFYSWRRISKARNLILMVAWSHVFGTLSSIALCIAARRQIPLVDAVLARFDASVRIEVPAILKIVDSYQLFGQILNFCYNTLIFLIIVAIMVPPLCGQMQAAKEYAIGSVLAVLIGLPVFATFQAIGPWVIYSYPPSASQVHYMQRFADIKSQGRHQVDLNFQEGLVCFPSFHTVLAVLPAMALWRVAYLRWPAALLAALIVLSTLTTGWHYIADVAAGLGLACVAHALAMGYSRVEAKLMRTALN